MFTRVMLRDMPSLLRSLAPRTTTPHARARDIHVIICHQERTIWLKTARPERTSLFVALEARCCLSCRYLRYYVPPGCRADGTQTYPASPLAFARAVTRATCYVRSCSRVQRSMPREHAASAVLFVHQLLRANGLCRPRHEI